MGVGEDKIDIDDVEIVEDEVSGDVDDLSSAELVDAEEASFEVSSEDAASETPAVESDLELALRQRDEFLRSLQLLQADFENYKKRVRKEQAEGSERAQELLIGKLLPALDTLSLALLHAKEGEADPGTVSQICSAVFDILAKEGLETVSPVGQPFDPVEAEAVAHEEGDGGPTVTEVFRSGYRWRGRVLRPAMVKVAG